MTAERILYTTAKTPWVRLLVASSERGLVAVSFVPSGGVGEGLRRLEKEHRSATLVRSDEANRKATEELSAYSAGDLQEFTSPLDLRGTDFQKSVWNALLEIPYGQTRTYADIARRIGHARAFRAVGLANHSNPVAIIVPCHRVVGSNGGLTGYGGGLDLKRDLLDHERRHAPAKAAAGSLSFSFHLK